MAEALAWGLHKNCGKGFVPKHGWSYPTADGAPHLFEYRFEAADGAKTYRTFHRVEGGYVAGDPPGPLPLYGLPALKDAERVYVVEGPKCARRAVNLGVCATTSSHGAKSPGKSDWSPLAGKEVVILPDNDGPGEGYAHAVAGLLARLDPRPSVKVVRLPGLPEGGDIVDWSEACPDSRGPGECRAALEKLVDEAPVLDLESQASGSGDPGSESAQSGPRVEMLCLADVTPRPVGWLWARRLPLGNLTIIAGDPGLGKSLLTLDIAARTSAGTPWPDSAGEPNPPGSVLVFSAEDDLETTVVPRLIAAGADLRSIHTIESVESDGGSTSFTLENLKALEAAIKGVRDVKLVVVDPVTAFLGTTDDHRNAEVRALLAPLAKLAAEHQVAVLLVAHMSKSNQIKTFNKIMGSVAYTAAARSVWAVVKREGEPKERLFLPVKNNLSPDPTGLSYRIDGEPPRVVWGDQPVEMHADDLMGDAGPDRDPKELNRAREFLRTVVGPGPVLAREAYMRAEAEGISEKTLKRAKKSEEIEVNQTKEGWWWEYPPGKGPTPAGAGGTGGQGRD
jgi:archaellum biogenesis ATPase FlaH